MTPPATVAEPFFAKGAAEAATRRLLLVSYHFPPDSSMGALRWEKMVAAGAERGWQVDVISMALADVTGRDDARLNALPAGTRVFGVQLDRHPWLALESRVRRRRRGSASRVSDGTRVATPAGSANGDSNGGLLRALRRSQLAWLYYDEWRRWCNKAIPVGRALVAHHGHDVVVSSGPPQMVHHAGWQIAKAAGIPYVMDLRDTWHGPSAEPGDVASPVWRRMSAHYERLAVANASLVVANTPSIEQILRERYPEARDRLTTIMNGADDDARVPAHLPNRFVLMHAGELYNGRDPRPLMRGLKRAIAELGVTPDELGLVFLGDDHYEGALLADLARAEGVGDFTTIEKRVPRAEAIRLQGQAAMLVLLPQNQWECVPGKVFEYVQKSSWVLAISARGTAVDALLRGTNTDLVEPTDIDGIARHIAGRYREFKAGVRPEPVNADGRFDRSLQCAKMFDALDRLASAR